MLDVKVGDTVMIKGKIKEIIINAKEIIYRVIINEKDPPNSFSNEVLVRGTDIVE